MYLKNSQFQIDGRHAIAFMARQSDCGPCPHRARCLQRADQKTPRQIHCFTDRYTILESGTESDAKPSTAIERMKRKIDADVGRQIYSRRLGTVEPVFGNITATLRMDRFTLRGRVKVNAQWLLYTAVHNIGKLQRYAPQLVT